MVGTTNIRRRLQEAYKHKPLSVSAKAIDQSPHPSMATKAIDRISSLHDDVAHHIMSFLPMKDMARTAVLSKRWESLWLAFPIHEFDERWFQWRPGDAADAVATSRTRFKDYLRRSLARREFTDNVKELTVRTYSPHDHELTRLVTRCVASALSQGKAQKLQIQLTDPPESDPVEGKCHHYILPREVYTSGSFLVSLALAYCRCGIFSKVRFPLLTDLSLRSVHVSNRQLRSMICNSPNLEILKLEICHGFRALNFSNPSLKCLVVSSCWQLVEFLIDAPCLNSFNYNGLRRIFRDGNNARRLEEYCTHISRFKITDSKGAGVCPSLETLVLSYAKIVEDNETFSSMLSSFPNVKTMKFLCSVFAKMPSTPLEKLRCVEIQDCNFHSPVDLNAQNLETLEHHGGIGKFCLLRHLGGFGFCTIKTLSLVRHTGLRDDYIETLLSSCIYLENLSLRTCGTLAHLKVISSTLKTLTVQSCNQLRDIEIQAPQLVYFKYVGGFLKFPEQVVSATDADVEFHIQGSYDRDSDCVLLTSLKKLIGSFDQAARVLTIITTRANQLALPLEQYLRTRPKDTGILEILLQVFQLRSCHRGLWMSLGDTSIELEFELQDCSMWGDRRHDCFRHHLRVLRLENFDGSDDQMELLTYFLLKSQSLEFLYISFSKSFTGRFSDHSEAVSKLMNYPRASRVAQIIFSKNAAGD